MLPLPSYDSQFITLFQFENGYVRRHVTVDVEAVDYKDVETIAIEKAMLGRQVDIMPEIVTNDPMRAVIYFDGIKNRNPDLRIDGELYEVEQSLNSININNLKHAIDRGSKQAHHVIVNVNDDITDEVMIRIAKSRFKDHKNLKTIEFRYKGIYIYFYK